MHDHHQPYRKPKPSRMDLKSKTEKIEAVRNFRRQNDSMCGELMKAKQIELSCQRCKERLLMRKTLMTASIQCRCLELEDVIQGLPASSRRLFDQLYSHVDEVYQLELLMLELNQQLMVAKATREEETILKALREVRCEENSHMVNVGDHVCILRDWFHQISCVKKVVDLDMSKSISSKKECSIGKDRVFYWARFDDTLPVNLGSHPTLTFSTRHCGICLRLCITAVIQMTEGTPRCNTDDYTITSDLPLEGLELGLHGSIKKNQMAHEFVIETVWRLMEDQLTPLMSS